MTAGGSPAFMRREGLGELIGALRADGRRVIGPTRADGAIVYDEIRSLADLPRGWGDEQAPGRYRLHERQDERLFGYVVGPTSWKRFTFPPRVPLWHAHQEGPQVSATTVPPEPPPMAFLGVRGCELAALAVQDGVLRDGPFADGDFRARRGSTFVVAVQCTTAASTCFCTSMGTGPEVQAGYDLALTELDEGFLVEAASSAGQALLERLPVTPADEAQVAAARGAVAAVRAAMPRAVVTDGLHDRLMSQLESPAWEAVAERCLGCANCTLACPTCFCTSVTQDSDLDGHDSAAERRWDSCFTPGFARVAGGGDFRSRPQDRYRQWLTHKFATWIDQFGTGGCVGCGRCITWCPVGIDVREELARIAPAGEQAAIAPLGGPQIAPAGEPPIAPAAEAPAAAAAAGPGRAIAAAQRRRPPREAARDGISSDFSIATVRAVWPETNDTSTLVLGDVDPRILAAAPGQFVMVERPAFPAVPISISRLDGVHVDLTIRAAGAATTELTGLGPGDRVALRGPLGQGWPLAEALGRDVVVVAGGIGLAPLRPLIDRILGQRERYHAVRICVGSRTPRDRLFGLDIADWATRDDIDFAETVDRAGADWLGRVGIVTHLFDEAGWDGREAIAFMCGPERMMQAAAETLAAHGVPRERTYVTMERHMQCGVGLCGHCQLGPHFVCRDGPVFSLARLGPAFGMEGL